MLFSGSPPSNPLKRIIASTPHFESQDQGVFHLTHFKYTAKMCDCSLCIHHKKKSGCRLALCPYMDERVASGAASFRDVMYETMRDIYHPAFRGRLNQYIKESERQKMYFKNVTHRQAFDSAIAKLDRNNMALMSSVYLLTADHKLWNQAKRYVAHGASVFETFLPRECTESEYVLFCCAKDLYLGTRHLSVHDLADPALIAPKLFGVICNAMAIRRFGLDAIRHKEVCKPPIANTAAE